MTEEVLKVGQRARHRILRAFHINCEAKRVSMLALLPGILTLPDKMRECVEKSPVMWMARESTDLDLVDWRHVAKAVFYFYVGWVQERSEHAEALIKIAAEELEVDRVDTRLHY